MGLFFPFLVQARGRPSTHAFHYLEDIIFACVCREPGGRHQCGSGCIHNSPDLAGRARFIRHTRRPTRPEGEAQLWTDGRTDRWMEFPYLAQLISLSGSARFVLSYGCINRRPSEIFSEQRAKSHHACHKSCV